MAASPENYDAVIIGAGPFGLMLSTCLARWGYRIKHIDNRPEPTATGRADGIQPRTVEFLQNMGLKRTIMESGPAKNYHVAFWDPCSEGIHRTRTLPSCPETMDIRYRYTAMIHQGFIERMFLGDMSKNGVEVQRPWTIKDFVMEPDNTEYPVKVMLSHVDSQSQQETVRTKYLFSAEGARSFIREKLGVQVRYKNPIAHVWGVVDGILETDFPDIRMKCAIHSDVGSVMIIPRENGLVRLYIQLASSTDKGWDPRMSVAVEEVQERARKIMKPYRFHWKTVEWYSAYPIGQGLAEKYSVDNRIFLGGDCCHTHSPKAGQGMNTAFFDAANLAWKIHHVQSGFARPELLSSYETERLFVADALLTFDAKYAKLFSSPLQPNTNSPDLQGTSGQTPDNEFISTFKAASAFTSGYGINYPFNVLNWSNNSHPAQSAYFLDYPSDTTQCPGKVLSPATLTRISNLNPVHLEQAVPFDGSFRVLIFAGSTSKASLDRLRSFCSHLTAPNSFYTSTSNSHTSHPLLTLCLIFSAPKDTIPTAKDLPTPFNQPHSSHHVYADDVPERPRLFQPSTSLPGPPISANSTGSAHTKMGFYQRHNSEQDAGIVIVRPDGYVGCVIKLVAGEGSVKSMDGYFGAFAKGDGDGEKRAANL